MEDAPLPCLELVVPDEWGDEAALQIRWIINEVDASEWKRPLQISISPKYFGSTVPDAYYENNVRLSREDARLLRDFVTSLLNSPDFRDLRENNDKDE